LILRVKIAVRLRDVYIEEEAAEMWEALKLYRKIREAVVK